MFQKSHHKTGPVTFPAGQKLNYIHLPQDTEKVIPAFITSQLNYTNALFLGLSQHLINLLKLVQNFASRLLTNAKWNTYITPILASIRWLKVCFGLDF